jgi:hypothetical protein
LELRELGVAVRQVRQVETIPGFLEPQTQVVVVAHHLLILAHPQHLGTVVLEL